MVQQVLDRGIATAGIATAQALEAALPRLCRSGQQSHPQLPPLRWKRKPLASLATMAIVRLQMHRLSRGRAPKPQVRPWLALLLDQLNSASTAGRWPNRYPPNL
ncbi:hypothetical protein A3218_26345 [Pseudomonas chlororaphis]|nr:hypothetical protein A3218_26345 [Pseudomonas chlororaphis]